MLEQQSLGHLSHVPVNESQTGKILVPEVPRTSDGRIMWRELEQDPSLLKDFIEAKAQELLSEGVSLTSPGLKEAKLTGLVAGIKKYYPNGIYGLRERLGLDHPQHPRGHWTEQVIEDHARDFYSKFGGLTQNLLVENAESSLAVTISKRYPGKLTRLKQVLGVVPSRKPRGFWTPQSTEEQALAFYHQYGSLSALELASQKRQDLLGAISVYPGKMRVLKDKLEIPSPQKPPGYWTTENMEAEVRAFLQREGVLSLAQMKRKANGGLADAIYRKYPGGITALTAKLGIKPERYQNGIDSKEANEQLERLLEVEK